jgi:beta-phosphoglucomutase
MKAVIFDLDGVIVSTDHYHYLGWKQLADEYNLNFNQKINDRLRGISRGESLKIILETNRKSVNEEVFREMTDKKNNYYCRLLKELSPEDILPGVGNLFKELREKSVLMGVGSSSRNTPLILEKIGLVDFFDAVVDGNQITRSKPDPQVFVKCAAKMNILPEACLVLEDAQSGIDAAKAGKMVAVGIGEMPLNHADAMFKNIKEISFQKLLEIFFNSKK